MCKRIKQEKPGQYGTYVDGSGSYEMLGWFGAFGAKLWDDGKLNGESPEMVKAVKYLKSVIDNGWSPPGSITGVDVDMWNSFYAAKTSFAAFSSCASRTAGKVGIDRGELKEEFVVRSIEYPTVPGVQNRPVMLGPDVFVVFDNTSVYGEELGEAKIKAAVELLKVLALGDTHYFRVRQGRVSARGVEADFLDMFLRHDRQIYKQNGLYDMTLGNAWYNMIRTNFGSALQAAFTGSKSVEEAMRDFQKETLKYLRY